MEDDIRKASSAFARLNELQQKLEDAKLGHLELASAGPFVTIAGVVRTAEERDRAIALAKAAGFKLQDAITIDDPSDVDELTVLAREARQSPDPFPILKKAIALADERNDKAWRIRFRLQLEEALRGPLRYAEAIAVCREAVAIEENAETLYALAYAQHEADVGFVKPAAGEIEALYERVIAMSPPAEKLHGLAQRMLEGRRRTRK